MKACGTLFNFYQDWISFASVKSFPFTPPGYHHILLLKVKDKKFTTFCFSLFTFCKWTWWTWRLHHVEGTFSNSTKVWYFSIIVYFKINKDKKNKIGVDIILIGHRICLILYFINAKLLLAQLYTRWRQILTRTCSVNRK